MLPEVRALLDLEGDGGVVEEELITAKLLTAWSDNAMTRLRAHVREQLKRPMQTADPADPDPLALAITYIQCPRSPVPWTTRPAVEWMHMPVRSTLRGTGCVIPRVSSLDSDHPRLLALRETRNIVEAYGLDTATTTYDAVLHETRRFNCESCVVGGLDWLGAIDHYIEYHLGNINGEEPNMVFALK
ncbi:hypothetical protein B0H10DRAFT_2197053 [Mycena sp. CBHHK59/15]|nr:hypothetical protein B0H10DRAFT_2197053 [Mycena sp. CBHHK59/15]